MEVGEHVRHYTERVGRALAGLDVAAVGRVVTSLEAARSRDATLFLAGNGGSSATAAHWVNDLNKATQRESGPPMRAANLSDNVPWLTAIANDHGYERVFVDQLRTLARRDDVLVVISASGNSPNLLAAVEGAQEQGLWTIGLLGFDGGRLRSMVNEAIWVESEFGEYGFVESIHSLVADMITEALIHGVPPTEDAGDGAR